MSIMPTNRKHLSQRAEDDNSDVVAWIVIGSIFAALALSTWLPLLMGRQL